MEEMRLSDRFIEFEKKNNLFSLIDNQGVYIWDIIRFELYINLMWDYGNQAAVKQPQKRLLFAKLTDFVRLISNRKKYDNFFYLCSRNERDGLLFDQNAWTVLEQFDRKKSLKFESWIAMKNKFILNDSFYNFPQFVYRKIFQGRTKFDFSDLIDQISKEFGKCPLNESQLKKIVDDFYSDLFFFKRLFEKKSIKRIFVTQNGIQKGLFRAAKELNIPAYEFQHGIVDHGHLAYNYPNIDFEKEQVYLPEVIFSLSKYWFSSLYLPFVKIYPIGNDFFSKKVPNLGDNTAVTVISADVFGLELQEFLLENINLSLLKNRKIYFKLHPNQFGSKRYYEDIFKPYHNIEVIAQECSVQRLLEKTEVLLTIQSTAVYEALQVGRKVILLRRSTYERHQDLFSNPNLHLVDNTDDLIQAIHAPISKVTEEFFFGFNNEVFQKAISDYSIGS